MKTKSEIEKALEQMRTQRAVKTNIDVPTIFRVGGWIEALEWVLNDK